MAGMGERRSKALACAGASTRARARTGYHERTEAGKGLGTRATSEVSREGQGGSLSGAYDRRRWGTEAQRTHWREGDAGHHAAPDGPTGETLSSPTVTPKLQRIAAQAIHECGRVFTILAHLIDENVLREAYRHTRKASAPGIDGVTAQM